MTNQELERRLEQALARSAPNDLEGVLSRCETRKGVVIPMTKKNKGWKRSLIAACLALALVGGTGAFYQQSYAVASVVSLDVNPSIELQVNKQERILSCEGRNEEAAQVLADMGGGTDLEGTKLDVAVNAIVGSLVRYGYLDSISSAILISVEDKDQNRASRLQQELTAAVDGVLQEQASNAAVLSQTVSKDSALEQQARDNNITTGKAALVNHVLALNDNLKFDRLAQLSVEELRDLAQSGAAKMPIGCGEAWLAAGEYAGALDIEGVNLEVDPELDEARAHYDVELFHPALGEFEYKVDAYTGEVYSGQKDILNQNMESTVTQEKAWDAAKAHAGTLVKGLDTDQLIAPYLRMESEDGRMEYKLEFYAGGYHFEYEIDAATGQITDWDQEKDEMGVIGGGVSHSYVNTGIGKEAAKAAALTHAGLKESQVTGLRVEKEEDDGRIYYDVEFYANGVEYGYEIDALDGAVWTVDVDKEQKEDVSAADQSASQPQSGDIGAERAKEIALRHAGLSAAQVVGLQAERDWDNGRMEYEVEFKANGLEYDYTIHGESGAVLEHEADRDDSF